MPKTLPIKKPQLAPGIIHIIVILIPLAIVAFIVITNFLPFGKNHSALAQVGEKAPDFSLNDFSGATTKLSDFGGKPIVLAFWDSRCLVCLEELLVLQKQQPNFSQVAILGIWVNDPAIENKKRAQSLVEKLQITFSQLEDTRGQVASLYKFEGSQLPLLYFIDKNGIVIERFSAAKTEAEITSQIQKLANAN